MTVALSDGRQTTEKSADKQCRERAIASLSDVKKSPDVKVIYRVRHFARSAAIAVIAVRVAESVNSSSSIRA
jgi:hypothetical protein